MAAVISRRQYALGIWSEKYIESVHKFLKSRRGGNVDFWIPSDHPLMLTSNVLSDRTDDSASAVDIK